MGNYALLLGVLVALLAGLAAGKAWERYKLSDGRWIDRRRLRRSPHFLQGLNFLVSGQIDPAIEEFAQAAALNQDAIEVQIILGALYREKGQAGRAIQIHQQLLQRPRLRPREQLAVLLSLGLDYRRGGFVDRAVEAFREVLRLDPSNLQALVNLEKLHEDQHQWQDAFDVRTRLAGLASEAQRAPHQTILAFLENELGLQALGQGNRAEAMRRFRAAVERDPAAVPAHLNLGDTQLADGRPAEALATWERLAALVPERAWLALDRLAEACRAVGTPERHEALCRRLIEVTPHDWRARLALSQALAGRGAHREALDLLIDAIGVNPHALALHQAAWGALAALGFDRLAVTRYVESGREAVFYRDPHVCTRCHYRSTELLWQCPHCREWNSFVEERLTSAREDGDSSDGSPP